MKARRVLFFSGVLSAILFLAAWLQDENLYEVERNSYGEGKREETYLVTIEGVMESQEITVEIQEQSYTEKELHGIFSEVMDQLDEIILGENESKDEVTKDLYLPSSIEPYPIEILWEMNRYDIVEMSGKLIAENLEKEGTLVELRGILSCQGCEAFYVTDVMIFPEEKSGKDQWISDVQESFQSAEAKDREEAVVSLPQQLQGKKVVWKEPRNRSGFVVLIGGVIVAMLLSWEKKQDEREKEQKRQQQLLLDYPEIVSKFAMLLTTGMTVKHAWNKIVQTYEEEQKSGKIRYAYEEMLLTCREMQGGVAEQEAYERFGKRCKNSSYVKFSMLLSQNLRKGSKGLAELLKMESIQAFEQRKNNAKKRGEEMSAKLMLPMLMMFAVVLVIIMIPAFLSIQI